MKILNSLISIKSLDVKVASKKVLVKNVDLEINKRDYIAIIGENGVGKSTLVEYLTKQRYSKNVKHKKDLVISYVPQFSMLEESVASFLEKYAFMLNAEKNLPYIIEKFSLKKLLDLQMHQVSAGERQRIILAISFLRKPDIIILDEFSTGLDEFARKQFISLIANLKEKYDFALVIVSHIDWIINELADKVYVIENERLTLKNE